MSHSRTLAQPVPFFAACGREIRSRGKEVESTAPLLYKTAVCAQYESLLKKCEAGLEARDEQRKEIAQSHFGGKEVGDEMLRAQADYAKAYTALSKHVSKCADLPVLPEELKRGRIRLVGEVSKVLHENSDASRKARSTGEEPAKLALKIAISTWKELGLGEGAEPEGSDGEFSTNCWFSRSNASNRRRQGHGDPNVQ